jgi:hypothetical protein
MSPLLVLADANILVKDVVSNVLFDLAAAKLIDLKLPSGLWLWGLIF